MKAAVCTEYGSPDVLQIQEVARPVPKKNEILIRVHAASLNYGDILARNMKAVSPCKFTMPFPLWLPTRLMFGFHKPRIKILGSEFAGVIEAVGDHVQRFKAGDQVFGYRGPLMGAHAEYLCMPENKSVAVKPANMTDEEAATVPYGAMTALGLLRRVRIEKGQKVLVNGASGGIGSYVVQLAKYFGAEVTGVCGTPRLEFVKALGADQVIDYTHKDFTRSGESYDLIVDILGKSSFACCKSSLKPKGIYLLASFKMGQIFRMLWTGVASSRKVICALSTEKAEDLAFIKELIETGKMKSIVDRCYPLEQVAEAHRYVQDGLKKGHVVLTLGHNDKNKTEDGSL